MQDYEKLQNITRNYEQKYTVNKIAQLCNRIKDLEKLTKSASKDVNTDDKIVLENKIKELENEVNELKKSKTKIENELIAEKKNSKKIVEEHSKLKKSKEDQNITQSTDVYLKEIKETQQETTKLLKQLTKSLNGKLTDEGNHGYLKKKIDDLEKELDSVKDKNLLLEKTEKMYKEQQSSVFLMKDSIESKEKTIQTQKVTIEALNDQIAKLNKAQNPFDNSVFIPEPTNSVSNSEAWNIKTQPTPVVSKKKPKGKAVNVENIFREENKSFFNNLSFSNSSPVLTKKFKKNFK